MALSRPSAEHRFTSSDGMQIAWARWDSRGPVRAVIQIAHGMGEHIRRYAETIEALRTAGFTVYGNDHRGHGRTARSHAELGDFGKGGFALLVEDLARLSRIAHAEHLGLPLFLMGHSIGSFAAQQFVLDHSGEIDGLILSGTGALDGLARLASSASPRSNLLNAAFEPSRRRGRRRTGSAATPSRSTHSSPIRCALPSFSPPRWNLFCRRHRF
jgi:alpha-beta hydrolase superfamily lysophospholipase